MRHPGRRGQAKRKRLWHDSAGASRARSIADTGPETTGDADLEHYYSIIGAAATIALFALLPFMVFRKKKRVHVKPGSSYAGPATVKFTCSTCSQEFTHTRRTIAAWQKGLRRMACDDCHRKWRDGRSAEDVARHEKNRANPAHAESGTGSGNPTNARSSGYGNVHSGRAVGRDTKGRSGCLGALVLISLIPASIAVLHILV